jgi:hypothetical protein
MTFTRVARLATFAALAGTATAATACSSSPGSGNSKSPVTSAASIPASTGASTPASAAGQVPDPCSLLTPQQVQTFTGEAPGTPSSSRSGAIFATERTCSWDPVITFVGLASDYADLQQTVTKDFGPVQNVQGVGQAAFWEPEGNSMAARNDKYFVIAELSGMGSTDSEAKQMARCKQILAAMLAKL